jgi:Alpha-2,8-polysialyltransferase (POLYST)
MSISERTIIVGVQGTSQLLAAITAIQYRENQFPDSKNDYILVVYDLFSKEKDSAFVKAIFSLSNLLTFKNKIFIDGFTIKKILRTFKSKKNKIDQLHQLIGVNQADEIYLCRNYIGFGSSFILSAYPMAVRITYGDGYGIVSEKSFFERFTYRHHNLINRCISNFKKQTKQSIFKFLGWDFTPLEFDLALLSIPVDYSGTYLKSTPYEFIPISVLEHLIIRAKNYVKNSYQHYVTDKLLDKNVDLLLLTSTFTESKYSSEDDEIELYLSSIPSFLKAGSFIVIKEHPRNSSNVSNRLRMALLEKGFEVCCLNDKEFNFIPIELSIDMINPALTISFSSSAPIVLELFSDYEQIASHSRETLKKYLFPEVLASMIDYDNILAESLDSIKKGWRGGTLLWSRHCK